MALISFVVTAKLICVFVFAYADCWFSQEVAQIYAFGNTNGHSTCPGALEMENTTFIGLTKILDLIVTFQSGCPNCFQVE